MIRYIKALFADCGYDVEHRKTYLTRHVPGIIFINELTKKEAGIIISNLRDQQKRRDSMLLMVTRGGI